MTTLVYNKTMKGFSLIEVIISIAIAGVLVAIVTNSFQVAQIKKQQQGITQSIVSYLEKQKADTQAGKGGSNYGVKFNATDFVLFKGTTYSPSASSNQIISIDPQFQMSETISNSDNLIYFSKLNGDSNETATITISHITNRVSPQMLTIESSGAVSVIE
jgi:prepilin-type N-terminal cleavage/methylation domain-containing protein